MLITEPNDRMQLTGPAFRLALVEVVAAGPATNPARSAGP